MTTIDAFIEELESNIMAAESGDLTPETRFRDLPWWDSLAVLATLGAFDTCFGRQLAAEDLKRCETVRDIYDLGASGA